MKKVLFVATVDSHILAFHIPYLKFFKEQGYKVYVATNGTENIPYCDKKYTIPIERSPFKISNLKSIMQLKKIIKEEQFELIHCHTPMGSVVTRLAAKKARKKYNTKVLYTAHGFHFYKGAPIINWLIYYPMEKFLSKYTDSLITINDEDYQLAKKKLHTSKIYLVNGVGISKEKFNINISEDEKQKIRKELQIKFDDCVILYVAELIKRKNQEMLIRAVDELKLDNIKVLLVGNGALTEKYQEMIHELQLEEKIKLLGFRKDIPQLMQISDIYVSTSRQEGLPVNIMEAMKSNLPIIATNCRGNNDLIENGANGYLVEIDDVETLKERILYVYQNYDDEKKKVEENSELIQKYLLENIMEDMKIIYRGNLKLNKE